jgi:type II secretory pathway component PulF
MKTTNRVKKSFPKPLPASELAQLYLQLERLQLAGIPLQEAITTLTSGKGQISQRAKVTLTYLRRGKSLAEAGQQAGLFIGLDATLIQIAETGGIYTEVFHQLAQSYEEQARYQQQIKSRLRLPLIILLLAIVIQPLPNLISGQLTLGGYFSVTVGFIIQLVLLSWIIWHLPRWLRHRVVKPIGLGILWDKLQLGIPYWSQWYIRRTLRNFMRSLGLMLQAGLPILEALPKAYEIVDNFIIRQHLQQIIIRLQQGQTFAEAILAVKEIDPIAIQLVTTGEHSGSLAEMMLHYAKLESEAIAIHNEMLAAWLPRLAYTLVVLWIIYGLFTSNPLTPNLPEIE